MWQYKIYILILLLCSVRSINNNCSEIMKIQQIKQIIFQNSGKFPNDLGNYDQCLFKKQFTYLTISFKNYLIGYQFIGLCCPNQCNNKTQLMNQLQQRINQINKIYNNISQQNVTLISNLNIIQSENNQHQMDWSSYVVLSFIILLLILTIIASITTRVIKNKSLFIKILNCFSFYDNLLKIFAIPTNNQNQNLLFLNGMRTIAIAWIVFGHLQFFVTLKLKNWLQLIEILTQPGLSTLGYAGYFSVDCFFWIGSFLLTIGLLEQLKRKKFFPTFFIGCVIHRLIRIWPTYLMAILIFWKIAPYVGSGPLWNEFYNMAKSCEGGGFLWNVFFIDNFADHGPSGMDYCFGWGWYLAVDFQLFLVVVGVVYLYRINKIIGWGVAFTIFIASIITAFILVMVNDWRYPLTTPTLRPQPQFMDQFYYRPYIRASAYMMGVFSGFIYHEWKQSNTLVLFWINRIKQNIPIRIAFYLIGITTIVITIWIITPYQSGQSDWSTVTQAFYNSLNRVFFLLGVYLCIFAAMFGCRNDPSKFILGHAFFAPLAKISFCIYLVHFIVIMTDLYTTRMNIFWENISLTYLTIAIFFWASLFALFLSLMIQSPILGIEKLLLRGKPKKQQKIIQSSSVQYPKKIEFKQDTIGPLRDSLLSKDIEIQEQIKPQFKPSEAQL